MMNNRMVSLAFALLLVSAPFRTNSEEAPEGYGQLESPPRIIPGGTDDVVGRALTDLDHEGCHLFGILSLSPLRNNG